MTAPALTTLRRLPSALPMLIAAFMMGLATSFAAPFMPLFAVQAAHMSPLKLGLYLTVTAVCSITLSTFIGRWSDRLPSRRPAVLLSMGSAALGFVMLTTTTAYIPLLLIGGLLLGTGASSFPQLFAYARVQFGSAGAEAAQNGLTTLRSVFSLAWVAGPLLGSVLVGALGFRGLFLCAAAAYMGAALPVILSRGQSRAKLTAASAAANLNETPAPVSARQLQLIALSFVLYGTALAMGAVALPLFITQELGGNTGQVGLLVGLCALLEIPVMLSFVLRPPRFRTATLMVVAFGLLAAYSLLTGLGGYVGGAWLGLMLTAQIIRAVVIAIASCLGMAYFQELMPGRVGAATTLFSNTSSAGNLVSGLLSGVWAQAFGYGSVFWLCAGLAAVACSLMVVSRRMGGRRTEVA
ncbi:MAG: sugar transporter [Deinococcus sp.]|nr:sugar transporter [Deinococcus sp.]